MAAMNPAAAMHPWLTSEEAKQADAVTYDYLRLSPTYLYSGVLINCLSTGRRYYVHSAAELPLNRVYRTMHGNRLEHVDEHTLLLNGSVRITIVQPAASFIRYSPVSRIDEVPAETFAAGRVQRALAARELWDRGMAARQAGDPSTACVLFETALSLCFAWMEMMFWAAMMRFELLQLKTGTAMLEWVVECVASPSYRVVAKQVIEARNRGSRHPHRGVIFDPDAPKPLFPSLTSWQLLYLPDVKLQQPLAIANTAEAKPKPALADANTKGRLVDANPQQALAGANTRQPLADASPMQALADANTRQPLSDAKPKQPLADAVGGAHEAKDQSTRGGVDADSQPSPHQPLADLESVEADSSPRGVTHIPASSDTSVGSLTVVRRRRGFAGGDVGENGGVEAAL